MKITVRQLIESLSKHDLDSPVQIRVKQYNQRYPVAYCKPVGRHMTLQPDSYAVCENGVDVSIDVMLPCDGDTFMITQNRKK